MGYTSTFSSYCFQLNKWGWIVSWWKRTLFSIMLSFNVHDGTKNCFLMRNSSTFKLYPYFQREKSTQVVVTGLFSSVQLLSRVRLFVTPWIAAHQASLSTTNSWSSLKLTSIDQWCHPAISSSVIPSPPGPNPSQHQSLFQWVNSSHEVAKVLKFQL